MRNLILWATLAVPLPVLAEFPVEKVEYVCTTAAFYYTSSMDECILEQYSWYADVTSMGMSDVTYNKVLSYGSIYNYRGDVVGIDFKLVLDRARYVMGQ